MWNEVERSKLGDDASAVDVTNKQTSKRESEKCDVTG